MSKHAQDNHVREQGSPLLARIIVFGIMGLIFATYLIDVCSR